MCQAQKKVQEIYYKKHGQQELWNKTKEEVNEFQSIFVPKGGDGTHQE